MNEIWSYHLVVSRLTWLEEFACSNTVRRSILLLNLWYWQGSKADFFKFPFCTFIWGGGEGGNEADKQENYQRKKVTCLLYYVGVFVLLQAA